ncbi:hypothetical protein [Tumebacillus permanentifrigoris]|uniref:Uncharacterized protein n=1 Tax=Tumebacillus permanentifrigoris TaxID=378543 RepID=A0A316DRN4_9BACL|nr:hypothetical protein [Tumebacillus permanentifrigoris]PWK07479.1 hypothetical protein C7459_11778 [Tumebacillus permanentifrigoris]
MRLLIGLTFGFMLGAIYGVQFAVRVPDSGVVKGVQFVKLLWKMVMA